MINRRDLLKVSMASPFLSRFLCDQPPNVSLCYKVCSKKYYSVFSPKQYEIKYELQEWIKPQFGKIFVFDSLDNAKKLVNSFNHIFIQPVKIYLSLGKDLELAKGMANCSLNHSWIEVFWKAEHKCKHITRNIHQGTHFVSEIKLLKEITNG